MSIPYLNFFGPPHKEPAISVDLETGGLRPDAPIVSIGAVRFYPEGEALPFQSCAHYRYDSFYRVVSLKDQPPVDNDTLGWWLANPTVDVHTLQVAALGGDGTLAEVLRQFALWVQNPVIAHKGEMLRLRAPQEAPEVWVRGNMDWTWLEQSFKRCALPVPILYSKICEQRTLTKFAAQRGVEMPERISQEHHALHDAQYQAECVQAVYKAFPLPKERQA